MSEQPKDPTYPEYIEEWARQAMEAYETKLNDPFYLPPAGASTGRWIASLLQVSEDELVRSQDQSIMNRLSAALSAGFTARMVFHEKRWEQLERRFQQYQAELRQPIFDPLTDKIVGWTEVSFGEAWSQLALPALLDAYRAMPKDLKEGRYRFLRRHVRRAIEQYLMNGLTTDSKRESLQESLADSDLDDEPDMDHSLGEFVVDMELVAEVSGLVREFETDFTAEDLELLQAQYGEAASLAERYGITKEAVWKRMERVRSKLKAWRDRHLLESSSPA